MRRSKLQWACFVIDFCDLFGDPLMDIFMRRIQKYETFYQNWGGGLVSEEIVRDV